MTVFLNETDASNTMSFFNETLAAITTSFINETLAANTTSFLNETLPFTEEEGNHGVITAINNSIRITIYTLLPVLFTIGIFGNILTLVVMGSNEVSGMASRYILVLLACCDMTMLVTHLFNKPGVRMAIGVDLRAYSVIGCKIFFHIYRTTKMMSSWLVVMLCLERFIAVVFPLKVKVIITRRRVLSLIAGTFLLLVTFNGVWSFSTTVVMSKKQAQCKQDQSTDNFHSVYRAFLVTSNAIFSWIPISIMMTLTPVIIYTIVKQMKRRQNMTTATGGGSEATRISAMLIGVVIAYVIFILPVTVFHINNSFINLGLKKNTAAFLIVREVVQYLEMMNYATNFIMYALCSVAFRNKARDLICRCRYRARDNPYAHRSSLRTMSTSQ